MHLWELPDDGIGFERYLESQQIPVIRVPFVRRTPTERVPEPEPQFPCGAAWEPEDDAARLARLLQAETMIAEMAVRDMQRIEHDRDDWRKLALWLAGTLLVGAVLNVGAAIWWAR